ncbi:midasin-like isoform X2 [Ostrea edulis]|uniref:midasin-like isoform X2 n=1 Tax=Ostrea edulis TaxID=37623 RepID=UPI0024AEF184|nr:midasin-like isoform X2 [Ostrea edulis]
MTFRMKKSRSNREMTPQNERRDTDTTLQTLGRLLTEPEHVERICQLCRRNILDLIYRARDVISEIQDENSRVKKQRTFCVVLARVLETCPYITGFADGYVRSCDNFLHDGDDLPLSFVIDLSKAALTLTHSLPSIPFDLLTLLEFMTGEANKPEGKILWNIIGALGEVIRLSGKQKKNLLLKMMSLKMTKIGSESGVSRPKKKKLSKKDRGGRNSGDGQLNIGGLRSLDNADQDLELARIYEPTICCSQQSVITSRLGSLSAQEMTSAIQKLEVQDDLLHKDVVRVAGLLLPRVTERQKEDSSNLVPVPSMMANLRSLTLAVAAGTPVLLQGPVGSGKTSLVQHLAVKVGRESAPDFMKIQLGDQTDSKALLGTYHCTDIPGEFVWRPGILMHAVTEGHWVLLEDVDYAPMDVVSVLLPLLERGVLSVPGHGDNITAHPQFRMFATQRLLGGSTGWHRQQSNSSVLLEKMWTKITIQPLSRDELHEVINTIYPQLTTVTDRLLDIYFLLSAGKHEVREEDVQTAGKFLSNEGRLISTRDLLNWCRRIAADFQIQETSTAGLVLQESLDCFAACIPNLQRRILVAQAIGAKLNVTPDRAEYYCTRYKPSTEITVEKLTIGRVSLTRRLLDPTLALVRARTTFSFTRQASALLERVAMAVKENEPVLLVGETGTGKTSSVQYLASELGHKLRVINMNQQSDSSDLLGGFKPMDLKLIVRPVKEEFETLFCATFSAVENAKFLSHIQESFSRSNWTALFTLMGHTIEPALKRGTAGKIDLDLYTNWKNLKARVQQLKLQVKRSENALTFTFIEGTLVKALKDGDWVLLDEINLAAAETLECLSGLLESTRGSIVLTERGDTTPVERHENFRIFACMNPATDVGKKDLPTGVRNRFTEFYVDELEEEQDLKTLVSDYLSSLSLTPAHIQGIVKFYLAVKKAALDKLTDGTGHKPHFSLRTLCRALRYSVSNPCGQVARSLYEGFCLSFLTQLDRASHPVVESLITQHIMGKANIKSLLKQGIREPLEGGCLQFEGYWVSQGRAAPSVPSHYILTPSVRANLRDLARVVSAGQHPVLLQGETSVGKTSLVTWLAQSSGNVCVRVNNHEHTDLQEYVGCYSADESGKLVFKEGVLVEAMRKGQWIILDELNLAPTDVLEALNRLLDDNRELFIPETQETVKAHPKFMLFATQNPPGLYGGRKILSRAFRNRFIELHFDEIPSFELETILHQRCDLPLSYAKRLVAAMLDLQTRRRGSGVFAGKQGFMTLRDLFRWADRYKCKEVKLEKKFYDWDQHMADHGYMLMAGRVRKPEEAVIVREVIQKHLKRTVDPDRLFTLDSQTSPTTVSILERVMQGTPAGFEHVVWTYGMRRLAVLIGHAVQFREPVLLVGDTGCGKTTVCQLLARLHGNDLHSINCHLHTESADFLGGLRPCRSHHEGDLDSPKKLFEWVDGPLVKAMKHGDMFLIDEISLADDSVLERLNSVLEPERTLLMAEKGGGDGRENQVEVVTATDGFQVFSTMNPGGDFGKKELSPALRNRFTEIWCPQTSDRMDLIDIIEHNLSPGIYLGNQEDGTSGVGRVIMDFVEWFSNNDLGKRCTVSIRDILSWVNFINTCSIKITPDAMETEPEYNQFEPAVALIHGACLVFLDGLGAGNTSRGRDSEVMTLRSASLSHLLYLINQTTHQSHDLKSLNLLDKDCEILDGTVKLNPEAFCILPYSIRRGEKESCLDDKYALQAPTTCVNAQRLLRGLQLPRPLLLEGSPGVGKTSLVAAIARAAGRELVRINLSEQTDVTDLFGADLPVEGEEGGRFAWRDGPLLRALKHGHWIVLDELNLASQSVLEGLNACLDHRAEVFIPELAKTFHIQHQKTRIFACQNPLNQGGGRKGLPRSFLNRFTQVYIEPLTFKDMLFIAERSYPDIPAGILSNMVTFNMQIERETMTEGRWGQRGGPWEFNLRDLFRWCELLLMNHQTGKDFDPGEFVGLLYRDRMRTLEDKKRVLDLYDRVFSPDRPAYTSTRHAVITDTQVQIGQACLPRVEPQAPSPGRRDGKPVYLLPHCLEPLESVMKIVQMNWMSIIVGGQSSGKSTLVQILSQLTGNKLHVLATNSAMDTTELLGGFEQSDKKRHVEEYATGVDEVMTSLLNRLLGNLDVKVGVLERTKGVKKLAATWKQYLKVGEKYKGKQLTTTEEAAQLQEKMDALEEVFSAIQTRSASLGEAFLRLQQKRNKALNGLQEWKAGQGAGTFEWIDSLLVQALQNGEWLMIDNVNFCNASVLDRLNALLEPNGVLSINERGVIDGEIPSIKPHSEFRLFLTMDPKFGEISRAMRNRGVEIYIPGEEEGNPYSEQDLTVMLHGIGVKCKKVSDWLISLYVNMREVLSRGERPHLLQLLQCGVTTVQQTDRGIAIGEAVRWAAEEVFVKTVNNVATRKRLSSLLESHCQSCDLETSDTDSVRNVVACSPVTDFIRDTFSANLHQQTALIRTIQQSMSNRLTVKDDLMGSHDLCTWQSLLSACMMYVDLSTPDTLNLHGLLLQQLLGNYRKGVGVSRSAASDVIGGHLDLIQDVMRQVFNCVTETVLDRYKEMAKVHTDIGQQYMDPRGSPSDPRCREDGYRQTVNLYTLVSRLSQTLSVGGPLVSRLKHSLEGGYTESLAVDYQTLENLTTDLMQDDRILQHFIHLGQNMDFTDTARVLDRVGWVTRMREALVTYTQDHDINKVILFYSWVKDKLQSVMGDRFIQCFPRLCRAGSVLTMGYEETDRYIKFWNSHGHPPPHRDQKEAEAFLTLFELCKQADVQEEASDLITKFKVQLQLDNRSYLVSVFLSALTEAKTGETHDNLSETLRKVRQLLQQYNLVKRDGSQALVTQMETDQSECTVPSQQGLSASLKHVDLWPLYDDVFVLSELRLVNEMLSSADSVGPEKTGALVNFGDQFTSLSPAVLASLRTVSIERKEVVRNMLCVILKDMYKQLWNNTSATGLNWWLNWSPTSQTDQAKLEAGFNRDRWGPASLLKAILSQTAYSLMCAGSESTQKMSHDRPRPMGVSLGDFRERLHKLQFLSQHIWCHGSAICCRKFTRSKLLKQHIVQVLISVLQSIDKVSNTKEPDDLYHHQVSEFITYIQNKGQCPNRKQTVQTLTETLTGVLPCDTHVVGECLGGVLAVSGEDPDMKTLGRLWVFVGLLSMLLIRPRCPVDPVVKTRIKLQLKQRELEEINTELEVRVSHHQQMTGLHLLDMPAHLQHPWILHLVERRQKLKKQIEVLQSQQAYRPHTCQYKQLLDIISEFVSTKGSVNHTLQLMEKLLKVCTTGQLTNEIAEERTWQKTHQRLVSSLQEEFPLYRDITTPFIVATQQVRCGMRMIASCATEASEAQQLTERLRVTSQVHETLSFVRGSAQLLGKYPFISSEVTSSLKLAQKILVVEKLVSGGSWQKDPNSTAQISRLHLGALFLLRNTALIRRELNQEIMSSLHKILGCFVLSWKQQEELQRQKEAEDSLYKYRTVVHGDDRDHEEAEEEEFRESFPSFHQNFQDLITPSSLEDTKPREFTEPIEETTPHRVTDREMTAVSHTHQRLFSTLSTSDWLQQGHVTEVTTQDTIEPSLLFYNVAAPLFNGQWNLTEEESQTLGSHLLASQSLQEEITPNSGAHGEEEESQGYDVYHDPNLSEVIKCVPVLHRLMDRVRELREEWPDHPTLTQVTQIVERILSFSVTSPVVKFLTGLELLLEKTQEWESNAAKHVSMATQLAEVSAQILDWRKLELSCWRQCLDNVFAKQSAKAHKWWFHIYKLIEETCLQDVMEVEPADSEKTTSLTEVTRTLKEFLERSTLGEFEARLGMLRSFHCQTVYYCSEDSLNKSTQDHMMRLLWNLHQFYCQFLPLVRDKIQQLRQPIEKELKGFVKIARWTDMNYWALKQTTDKTHRTLHKHMRAFQAVLEQSVQGILSDPSSSPTSDGDRPITQTWREHYMSAVQALISHRVTVQLPPSELPLPGCGDLQGRLGRLSVRMCKHWKSLTGRLKFHQLIVRLDEFTGEIIESIQELQQLEVSQIADKEKQKSEAKHIGQKKRKALSDLFKELARLGLSYRKGLLCETENDLPLLVSPLDVSVSANKMTTSRTSAVEIGQSCHDYYYKCIARKAKFVTALQTPSKELGVGNIERCKGFTEHLMNMVVDQYSGVAEIHKAYIDLSALSDVLQDLCSMKRTPPPQKSTREFVNRLSSFMVSMKEGLIQVKVILTCCPQQQGEVTHYPSPFPRSQLSHAALMKHGDEQWRECQEKIQRLQVKINQVVSSVSSLTKKQLITWSDCVEMRSAYSELVDCVPSLTELEQVFCDPEEKTLPSFLETVKFLRQEIEVQHENFTQWYNAQAGLSTNTTTFPSMEVDGERQTRTSGSKATSGAGHQEVSDCQSGASDGSVENFCGKVENLIAGVLLSVQKLTKGHAQSEQVDSGEGMLEGHLVVHLNEKLKGDKQCLQLQKITQSIHTLVKDVLSLTDTGRSSEVMTFVVILGRCLPLIQQYRYMLEYFLLQCLAENRVTGKLLSVLLGVFTELAAKGFCAPAEFEDEMTGEGARDFEDIEGGGLGQGEGVKDVSDQIENEDQLDEAKPAGEERKEEDSSQQPDIRSEEKAIEMSEDFEGKAQDLEDADKEEKSDGEEEGEEEELDKQMGEVDGSDREKLDDQMWGSDEEEGEDQGEKEEFGPGSQQEQKSELVAKDDNQDKTEAGDKSEQMTADENEAEENDESQKPKELEQIDESEYDDDRIDPNHGNQEPQDAPDNIDLPDDLKLDEEEAGVTEEQDEPPSEPPGGDTEMTEDKGDNEDTEQTGEDTLPEVEPEKCDDKENQTEEPDNENQTEEPDTAQEKGEDNPGYSPQNNPAEIDELNQEDSSQNTDNKPQATENYGKTSHDSQNVEQSESAQNQGGEADNDQKESDGTGTSNSEVQEGHEGQSSKVAPTSTNQSQKPAKRKAGHSNEERSLGSNDNQFKKLKTIEESSLPEEQEDGEDSTPRESELYEHIKDARSAHDSQTLDVATDKQQIEQAVPNREEDQESGEVEEGEDVEMREEEEEVMDDSVDKLSSQLNTKDTQKKRGEGMTEDRMNEEQEETKKFETEGVVMETLGASRGPESTIHTTLENLHLESRGSDLDMEKLRSELEEQLSSFTNIDNPTPEAEMAASEAWHRYEALTSTLSQELCEQLRLVLEPSQATKLRGDYRTGKRLNMRKVIPYIASQFRKDKIWLRRTKPSKRQYQIMLAIDDSSSMVDNHSKQLAYESLALISNALTLLEAGDLSICSFGESVRLLHPFTEQFTSQSGSRLLQQFTFEQKKTKVAQLIKKATSVMMDARSRQRGMLGNPETSQLLLIVSDGRGLFNEGMETVKSAVRQAREANVFLVFVVIDNPQNKDSILDIKVPVFKSGNKLPEIQPYMNYFPFPFYIILRDINSLPHVLCDALRQWFELVTAVDV